MKTLETFLYLGNLFGGCCIAIYGLISYRKEKIGVAGSSYQGKKAKNISLFFILLGLGLLGNIIRIVAF